jgi:hypothetical protein
VTARKELLSADERRRQQREERLKIVRQIEEEAAEPRPFRVTLAEARASWPEWVAAHNKRRVEVRRAATEKVGPIVAKLLVDIHVPELPPPTEVVAFALELECGHEAFSLAKRTDTSPSVPERGRCPVVWSCQLNDGRTAVRYVEAGEPECEDAKFGFTRWSVALACGHSGVILRGDTDESRVGDFLVCQQCEPDDPYFDVEIVALGERLPDLMVQNWVVELTRTPPSSFWQMFAVAAVLPACRGFDTPRGNLDWLSGFPTLSDNFRRMVNCSEPSCP